MGIWEIGSADIERVDARQLTALLKKLLHSEAESNRIPRSAVSVSLKIEVPDGGEDGRIRWDGGPEKTDYVPKRFTVFQCKATDMDPADCKKELLIRNTGELKPRIQDVLDKGGAYVLFLGRHCNKEQQEKRLCEMRNALREARRGDAETADLQIYDSEKIADWANKFLAAVIYVRECTGGSVPAGSKTWEKWSKYEQNQGKYFSNSTLDEYIRMLKEEVAKERSVVRIVGLSGLGKTRLAFEAFRPPVGKDDINQEILSQSVVYLDGGSGGENFINSVSDMCNMGMRGTLVVDECGAELHRKLDREVERSDSRLGLVTLDYDPEELPPGIKLIHLKQEDCKGVVKQILQNAFRGMSNWTLGRIEEFAQDFPSIAVLLGESVREGAEDVGRLSDSEIVRKLLWGREPPNREEEKIINACSLVSYFELSDHQCTKHVRILSEIAGASECEFYRACIKFAKRGIIQRRGRFARVCPRPLALTLAADWWEGVLTGQAKEIIAKVAEGGLAQQFCEQMKYLHFSRKAQEVTKALCGEQGPFGSVEVLNSEEGSRLFLALVEVSPEITVDTLERVFGGWTREQLLEVGPGRRNLIQAVGKLCWWDETFTRAAKLMLAFAAAENEAWGNNASGQFLQLFHVYLSGTEAPLKKRLEVVKDALSSSEQENRKLGVRALGAALSSGQFMRMSGVEAQGSRVPTEDYWPKGGEIHEYWKVCMDLLKNEVCNRGDVAELARKQLAEHICGLIKRGMIGELEAAIREIVEKTGSYWPEGLQQVRFLLDHEDEEMPQDIRERIERLEKLLSPEDLKNRLRSIVSRPGWRYKKGDGGHYSDISAEEAERLAEELSESGTQWYEKLSIIFEGEQQKGCVFGRKLGEVAKSPKIFIDASLECLKRVPAEKANPVVLGAFLGVISDRELVDSAFDQIVSDEILIRHVKEFVTLIKPDVKHLEELMGLLDKGKVGIEDLYALSYGGALEHLDEDCVTGFCERLRSHGTKGTWCAFEILYMHCFPRKERFTACAQEFRKMLMTKGLLSEKSIGNLSLHEWKEMAGKLLTDSARDVELAEFLSREIVESYKAEDISYGIIDNCVKPVVSVLLKDYLKETWPIISGGLLSDDWRLVFNVQHLLGVDFDKEKSEWILSVVPEDVLVEWCEKNKPRGPALIAEIMPVFAEDKETWHPFAQKVISQFGYLEEVLRALSGNIWSFSSCGSRVPYYQRRVGLFRKLIDHPMREVRAWAQSTIESLEKEVKNESLQDEEREFGIL